MNIDDWRWLDELRRARTQNEVNKASGDVLRKVFAMVVAGEFERCTVILRLVAVNDIDVQVLLAFLASTIGIKNELPDRSKFYNEVEFRLRRDMPSRVDGLLRGLK